MREKFSSENLGNCREEEEEDECREGTVIIALSV